MDRGVRGAGDVKTIVKTQCGRKLESLGNQPTPWLSLFLTTLIGEVLYPMRIEDMTQFGFVEELFPGQDIADD